MREMLMQSSVWSRGARRIGQRFVALSLTLASIALLGSILVSGCGEEAGREGDVVTVLMEGRVFDPQEITIEPGVTVRWVNQDETSHTSTAEGWQEDVEQPLLWNSTPLNPGEAFEYTFDTEGIYDYFCMVHQSYMKGRITVVEEGGPEPTDVFVPSSTTTTADEHGETTTTTGEGHEEPGHGETTTTEGGHDEEGVHDEETTTTGAGS